VLWNVGEAGAGAQWEEPRTAAVAAAVAVVVAVVVHPGSVTSTMQKRCGGAFRLGYS